MLGVGQTILISQKNSFRSALPYFPLGIISLATINFPTIFFFFFLCISPQNMKFYFIRYSDQIAQLYCKLGLMISMLCYPNISDSNHSFKKYQSWLFFFKGPCCLFTLSIIIIITLFQSIVWEGIISEKKLGQPINPNNQGGLI